MSIDLRTERAITLCEVPDHVPRRRGKKVHYSTVFRWVSKGARGQVLESVLIGGVRYTSVEALARFLSTAPAVPRDDSPGLGEAIEAALRDAGV